MRPLSTGRGDKGETDLIHFTGIRKDHPAIEAIGTVDELNAEIGVCIADLDLTHPTIVGMLTGVQDALMRVQTDLGTVRHSECVMEQDVKTVEFWTVGYQKMTPDLKNFILPGGTREAALLHRARTVCRRAERAVVAVLDPEQPLYRDECGSFLNPNVVVYLNRLSDLLFALARYANHRAGEDHEVVWRLT